MSDEQDDDEVVAAFDEAKAEAGDRNERGQWTEGVSGNPGGRKPKRLREIEDELRSWLADGPRMTNVLKKLYFLAMKGNVKAAQLMFETCLGKPRQRIDVSGEDGDPIRMKTEAAETLSFLRQLADGIGAEGGDGQKPS